MIEFQLFGVVMDYNKSMKIRTV